MKPSLLIISFSDILKDARVLKQVRAFASTYEVTTCGFGEPPVEGVEHIRVDPVAVSATRSVWSRALTALNLVMSRFHRFGGTYWRIPYVASAGRLLGGRRFDAVLANDVDTVPIAIRLVGASRVHADLHEYFPGLFDATTVLGRRQNAYLAWLVTRYAARASSSTTVSLGIAAAYKPFGLACDVVTNATPFADLSPRPVGNPIRLVHSGIAQVSRELELTMRAVATSSSPVTLDLFLMPNDAVYLDRLRALAGELGSRVRVLDPLPQSQLVTGLNDYDIGIFVLPPTSFNNANALPNKFFDFVQARLAIIVGPTPDMAALVRENGLGAVTGDFSIEAIQETLNALTPEAVAAWKENSDASATRLSAISQTAVWVRALERLVPHKTLKDAS